MSEYEDMKGGRLIQPLLLKCNLTLITILLDLLGHGLMISRL